jgi:predicted AlkP superfamily pyrophosphatase or phosphodiesterase
LVHAVRAVIYSRVKKTVVINAVGLTPALIGPHTPRLAALRGRGRLASIGSVLPAVTTTVQSTYLTGTWPSEHGIVGNGWYFRDESEIRFWKQADALVQRPRLWTAAKQLDPSFTCANICWWYAMYSSTDYTVTPRPMYPADGRKIPDVWTHPGNLRTWLQEKLGPFPLFKFWGPATDMSSTRWIADAARLIDERFNPTLSLVYLPHLDYCLQRRGPNATENDQDLRELDEVCGQLIDHFQSQNARVIVLSEYGITNVSRPVHLNRALREHGLITVREELGRELLDAGASAAFAVADHQIAHVYVNDRARISDVWEILEKTPGVGSVIDESDKREVHLDHPRAGDLVALAAPDSWFTYYYWLDDARAPDFARTVDIHRKPGYDPAELFIDPKLTTPKLKIATALLRRRLGFRALMEVIPLDATLVRGSHGLPAARAEDGPLLLTNSPQLVSENQIEPTDVAAVILRHLQTE